MGNMLDGVALTVGEVIHRVDAPLVARAVMACMLDSVKNRIAHHHILGSHVDFGPQHLLSVSIFPSLHVPENPKILLRAAVPVRAFLARSFHRPAAFADFFLGLVIHVSQASADQFLRPFVKLIEIVRGVALLVPLETHPANILLNRIDIFSVLLRWVSVIVAKVGLATVFLGKPEVDAEALGMT